MGPRPKFPAKSTYRESSFASLHRGRGIRNDSQSEGSPFLSCLGEKICVYFLTGPFLHARSVVTKNRPPPHAHWIQNCERKGPLKTSTTLLGAPSPIIIPEAAVSEEAAWDSRLCHDDRVCKCRPVPSITSRFHRPVLHTHQRMGRQPLARGSGRCAFWYQPPRCLRDVWCEAYDTSLPCPLAAPGT